MGRPVDRKRAKKIGQPMQRTKPIMFTPEEQANITTNATEGVYLASQGRTAIDVLQEVEQLRVENAALRHELGRYQALYGVLEDEATGEPQNPPAQQGAPAFNVETFYNESLNLED